MSKPRSESAVHFYQTLPGVDALLKPAAEPATPRLEPSTCTEAETFALRVLDDSMQPEFRRGCIIIVDPTGHAKDGSYVLAKCESGNTQNPKADKDPSTADDATELLDDYVFRQLKKLDTDNWQLAALNPDYDSMAVSADMKSIVGVIVQRAGTRRRYHKRYD